MVSAEPPPGIPTMVFARARPAGEPEVRDLNHDLFPRDEFNTR